MSNYGIGAPPSSGGSGSKKKKKPIGVPEGYSVAMGRPVPPGVPGGWVKGYQVSQGPRYFKGDEWQQAPSNSQDILTLQQAMAQTGLLDPKGIVYGQWDPKSATAFSKLLAISNQAGVEWQDALSSRIAATAQGELEHGASDRAAKAPPLTIKLSNPEDLKAVAQNLAKTMYGGNLPDDVANRFISSFQQSEREVQTAEYNAQYGQYIATGATGTSAGGEATATPDPTVAAQDFIKNDPATHTQYMATQFGTQVQDALRSLRSTGNLS